MKTKTVFFIVMLSVLASFPVHAQGGDPPIPKPPPDGKYILDELDWLTNDQENEVNSIIQRLDTDGLAEIAVVTLNDCGTDKLSFRKSLFNTWGIGHTDDNDGLLILVCWYRGDKSRRSVEQEFGPGLNGFVTGERTDQIMQTNFVPAFQQERPGEGLVAMVRTYEAIFSGNSSNQSNNTMDFYRTGVFVVLPLILFATAIIMYLNQRASYRQKGNKGKKKSSRSKGGPWWLGGDGGSSGYDGGGGFDGGGSDGGGGSSSDF